MIFLPQCIKSYDIVYSNYIKISYYTASGLLQIRKLDLNMCTNLCLLKYFAFFSSTEAVIDMIFVDLGFSQKDLHLLFWGINSYGHTYCTISINLARGWPVTRWMKIWHCPSAGWLGTTANFLATMQGTCALWMLWRYLSEFLCWPMSLWHRTSDQFWPCPQALWRMMAELIKIVQYGLNKAINT